jgi:mannose-6-phosphate isomerase-like protein (cupin superfamily)
MAVPERTRQTDALTNSAPQRIEADIESHEQFMALREAWKDKPMIPVLIAKEDAPLVSFPGQDGRTLLSSDQSGGTVAVFHLTLTPGFYAQPHHQEHEEEFFYVLSGQVELTIGNQTKVVGPGHFGFAPRWATHAFRPVGGVAELLTWNSPGGHERMFEGAQKLKAKGLGEHGPSRQKNCENHDTFFHDTRRFDDAAE